MEPLYQTAVLCPCCDSEFKTTRVRPSFKRTLSVDSDFCGYYKDDVNPDYYVVRVCPLCGFSTTENSLAILNEAQKSNYYRLYGRLWNSRSYGDTRVHKQALDSYKLALLSALAVGDQERIIAGLLHHIAWLHRLESSEVEEIRFLRHALNAYHAVYEHESVENDAKLMFLIGELHRRVGDKQRGGVLVLASSQ